jgi:hypothetical protein
MEGIMLRSSRVVRDVAGVVALSMLALLYTPPVQAQTGMQEVVACIEEALGEYTGCLADLPWWAEVLCAARFLADAALCTSKIALDAAR